MAMSFLLFMQVSASGEIMIEFDLLDKYLTDPPDVPSLSSAIALLEQLISESQLRVRTGIHAHILGFDLYSCT